MSLSTKIEWTDATWNPVTGCTKVSRGCDRCYAQVFAERWRGTPGNYFEGGFDLQLRPNMLKRPEQWRRPRRVFVNSMSDLFHAKVPDEYIDLVFGEMERIHRHVYQVLTKRADRMRSYLRRRYGTGAVPKHIWLGVSVESNAYAWRADMLRQIQVPIRFLSIEPLLGPVNSVDLQDIGWVIVGGESGPGYRPMHEDWVRDVRDRCIRADIPFFFKQWHKAGTGRLLDARTWDGIPPLAAMGM